MSCLTGRSRFARRLSGVVVLALLTVPAAVSPGLDAGPSRASDEGWWASIERNLERSEYHVTWQDRTAIEGLDAAWHAPNRAHGFRTYFTEAGPRLVPRVELPGEGWTWGLSWVGYGRGKERDAATLRGQEPRDERIAYDRGAVIEWYVNDPRGLEQGFTLAEPPPGTGPVHIDLRIEGTLQPVAAADGDAIDFLTAEGVRVLRYSGLVVEDATGEPLPAAMSLPVSGSRGLVRLTFEDDLAVYPVTVDPLATSPAWTAEGDQADAAFGSTVAGIGDLNGDGFSDVVVGAPLFDNGEDAEGRVYAYYGSATGLQAAAAWSYEADQAMAHLGAALGAAGDVDGDGFADLIVGVPDWDNGSADVGRAVGFLGGPAGFAATPDWSVEIGQLGARFGAAVGGVGDVDDDGFGEVVVGAPGFDNGQLDEGAAFVFRGSASGPELTAAWMLESNNLGAAFGHSVSLTGDVNGDGYADVAVGAPQYKNGENQEGAAYIYFGSASGVAAPPSWFFESNQIGAEFGEVVGPGGDVNGDGYSELVIGAPHYNNGLDDVGRAFLYHGGPSGPSTVASWTGESSQSFSEYATSVAAAGDVNGDGYGDLIVGSPLELLPDEGSAFVYHGSPQGLGTQFAWRTELGQAGAAYGTAVAAAGDVNGDGYSDVIVGAPGHDNGQSNEGRAYVYLGSQAGPALTSGWAFESDQIDASGAAAVAMAGDVNGDGYSDVIVGAYRYDNGQDGEGVAWVFHGSATGLPAAPSWTAEGDLLQGEFGRAVAGAGDVNGDGYADVIVGSPLFFNDQAAEGGAFVFAGSVAGLSATPLWSGQGDGLFTRYGAAVASAGDLNGDGFGDIVVGAPDHDDGVTIDEGWAYVYLGSPSGPSLVADWMGEGNKGAARYGSAVGTAGDVDRDGDHELLVGAPDYEGGRAFLYYGSSSGPSLVADWVATTMQASSKLGNAVGTAGDVNGDGYSDLILGARQYTNVEQREGRALVFLGSSSGPAATPDWSFEGNQEFAEVGTAVSTAGDVNGDGYSDVLVGSPLWNNPQSDEGTAFLFLGSASGLPTTPSWTAESNVAGFELGRVLSGGGDVNGDGYADLVVGVPGFANLEAGEGQVRAYFGNRGPSRSVRPRQRRADNGAPVSPLGLADAGDRFRILAHGTGSPFGATRVKLEWEVKPTGTPFDATGTGISADWSDSGLGGVELNELVLGLAEQSDYHWRARLHYHPLETPLLSRTRWFTPANNGAEETDLRMRCLPGNDVDGDTFCVGTVDCDDSDPDTYPGAPDVCDGLRNDCDDPGWPQILDADGDLDEDACDTCTDTDGDGLGDPGFPASTCPTDNCPDDPNAGQEDADADDIGDLCDACPLDPNNDADGDGVCGNVDNCPVTPNPSQSDADADTFGDACDICTDTDGDGRGNPGYPANTCLVDNCPNIANPLQQNADADQYGDVCDPCPMDNLNDIDADGFCAGADNCPTVHNPSQSNVDGDGPGDACDLCTDTDADGFGNPGYPASTCPTDNCPTIPNATQDDADADQIGDVCDPCGLDPDNDSDADGICGDVDNCPQDPNADQANLDGDGEGDVCDDDDDGDGLDDGADNCPLADNPLQENSDGDTFGDACDNCPLDTNEDQADGDDDGVGDVCDTCIDSDGDGFGDPGQPAALCDIDGCPSVPNPDQADEDGDGVPDACDPCPLDADSDGDGVCDVRREPIRGYFGERVVLDFGAAEDLELVSAGTPVRYLPNAADPGIALDWIAPAFADGSWPEGTYGLGYETFTGVENLYQTLVPTNSKSVYSRARFWVDSAAAIESLWFGADYDDGIVVWLNGTEVYRSPSMPAGAPAWNSNPSSRESSNQVAPNYEPQFDLSSAIPLLVDGENVLAVGVYNSGSGSSDLVVVPRLSANRQPRMRWLANPADPGIGLTWTAEVYDDASWTAGWYGVGDEGASGVQNLIVSEVPGGSYSVYTRTTFEIPNVHEVRDLFLGLDYDDGVVAWINGVEVYRTPSMGGGTPQWNTVALSHEASNQRYPVYAYADISTAALPALHGGTNTLAIGVWNNEAPNNGDLLLAPRLSYNRAAPQTVAYLANSANPLLALTWVQPGFNDAAWPRGAYGMGFENGPDFEGAKRLLRTTVPVGTRSIYTRAVFQVADADAVSQVVLAADYDDGWIAWVNGVEVYRSPEMPGFAPQWDTIPLNAHESSNGVVARYDGPVDVTSTVLPVLVDGPNVLAIGVWNKTGVSEDDLVLVPRLTLNGDAPDNCPAVPNPEQSDVDEDGEGDSCDLDDGRIDFTELGEALQAWQADTVYDSFNLYRGDLAVLRATGVYTQPVGGNADRFCALASAAAADAFVPPVGSGVFYVVSGNDGGGEGSIGQDSTGAERPNDNPCP